jgi:hypothetical protein
MIPQLPKSCVRYLDMQFSAVIEAENQDSLVKSGALDYRVGDHGADDFAFYSNAWHGQRRSLIHYATKNG